VHPVPGEHDSIDDGVAGYLKFFSHDGNDKAWYSFEQGCVQNAAQQGIRHMTSRRFRMRKHPLSQQPPIAALAHSLGARSMRSAGTIVAWTNHDLTPHTVTSNDKSFGSKGLDTDDKFEHTFATEGDFSYVCALHRYMHAVVHVRKP
jgi:hypothetical protein